MKLISFEINLKLTMKLISLIEINNEINFINFINFFLTPMYRGNSLTLGKVCTKCLKRCREMVEPKLEDTQCCFRRRRSATDQIFTI